MARFVLVLAVLIAMLPVATHAAPASTGPSPGPAQRPERVAQAEVTHGAGSPAPVRMAAMPLRHGPFRKGTSEASPRPEVTQAAPLTTVVAGANHQGLVAGNASPSDSTGAIGPLHYIEMINLQVGLFDRTLASPLATVSLPVFLGTPAGLNTSDVQVQWDAQAARWEYSAIEYSSGDDKVAFGWSKTGDPSALTLNNMDWCNFHYDTATNLWDYDKLGHDASYLLVGANIYPNASGTFANGAVLAAPQPAPGDMSCTPPLVTQFSLGSAFTPVPANVTDAGSTSYITSITAATIDAWHVSPTAQGLSCPTPPCLVSDGGIPITAWALPPVNQDFLVPQIGGYPNIDALDGRLTQAVEHGDPGASNGEAVWTQHTSYGLSGRAVVTWFELLPGLCGSGSCPATAERQEGVVASPSVYIFNAAISPTSHGDAAVIEYNTGSASTLVDVRARSHDAADPMGAMSGELILRSSSVADTEFTCSAPLGPPCRWGDYSGASPDPSSCSEVWGTNMLTGDVAANGGNPTWVTQNFALQAGPVRSTATNRQYYLAASDGQTWTDVDTVGLRLHISPCSDTNALITANADVFTGTAGVNQDLGIFVDTDGVAATAPLAWKESGGFNGAFSPNASYVQAVMTMPAGHTYAVRLKWKSNVRTGGAIYAGAGPLTDGTYSPTSLTAQLLPAAPLRSGTITQPKNAASDGASWMPIPGVAPLSVTPSNASRFVIGGNADLWTDVAGVNQDLGITIAGGAFAPATLLAWKEGGGFSGTFSPSATFVQAAVNLAAGATYTFNLVWKANSRAPAGSSIYAGAGPLAGGAFSPTSLVAVAFPAGANPVENVITTQPSLSGSGGVVWSPLPNEITMVPTASSLAIVTAGADLWTANAGFNQDLAIFVSDNGGGKEMLAWKESGGLSGTFSPNAAFAETVFPMVMGHTYVFSLWWKTNRASGATIYAGAGPIGSMFSPTRLAVTTES